MICAICKGPILEGQAMSELTTQPIHRDRTNCMAWPPPAIRRLMDEVRLDGPAKTGTFDRAHNRHNRS